MGSHSITRHPTDVTFLPLHLPVKAGDHEEMEGWDDVVGLGLIDQILCCVTCVCVCLGL